MSRLIIITAVKFLACRNQIQLIILKFGDLGHQTGSFGTVYANVGQLKVNNNKVMCQMSMKLLAMFDQNPPHTLDLDLDPKCQGHSRNQKLMTWGTKKHATQKKFEQGVP